MSESTGRLNGPLGRRAKAIGRRLARAYPGATCSLDYRTPLELLVATILSAQCTDQRVNKVTPGIFDRYADAAALADADLGELESAIRSTGFFHTKARNIQQCCRVLVSKYGGRVPEQMDDLVALPGVGRKTANVIMGNAFGRTTGVVVDTHVRRLSQRMGLTAANDPEKIEQDLMRLVPKTQWIAFGHRMILHGRQVCAARKPVCERCAVADLCPKVGV